MARTESEARQWLAQYEQHGRELVEQSERIGAELASATETVASSDGIVTVTVGASGNLQDVQFSDRVRSVSPSELRNVLMRTVQQAQTQVAHKVAETVAPLAGDGETMEFIRSQLPPLQEPEDNTQPPGSTDDDDDFGDETFLR